MASSETRTVFFQRLKPICVPLSQLAIRSIDKAGDVKEILRLIAELTHVWTQQAQKDAGAVDDKLADYVFFPLSNLLRNKSQYPVRLIEAIVSLLRPLIQYGWQAKISKDLASQLVIFLTLTLEGASGSAQGRGIPEETKLEAYRTLTTLVKTIGRSPDASSLLVEEASMKTLGHAIAVVLDGITDGENSEIQLQAVQCLTAVFSATRNHRLLATFLPGTVSSLSKVLSLPQRLKTQMRVLKSCIEALKAVVVTVLGDIKTRNLLQQKDDAAVETGVENHELLTPAWLTATTAQVRIALASVLKLRNVEGDDLQGTLYGFCVSLLDECHLSLKNCRGMLVETAMVMEGTGSTSSPLETGLRDLAGIYPALGETIKTTTYNWVTGLPRIMQTGDERVKQQAIRNLSNGSRIVSDLQLESSTLENALGDSLKDSLVVLLRGSKTTKVLGEIETESVLWESTDLLTSEPASPSSLTQYRPVLLVQEGQKRTRQEIMSFILDAGSSVLQTRLAAEMLGYVRDSEGVEQVAAYWLAFELIKATYNRASGLDSLLDLSSLPESKQQALVFQELYEFSASILSSHSDLTEVDWRLEAVALEVTAYAASRMRIDFRPELIDVLYPITTFLGAENPQLRGHAITTLNNLAACCGYASVSDLIIDNADYMVNSVSLRLNTFDISPSSTKVLTMMIRLTGPRLIPYLDDVVASIFAALDSYHGYTSFVEGLFSVLQEVVRQGVKSDSLLIQDDMSKAVDHKKRPAQQTSIGDIMEMLTTSQKRKAEQAEDVGDKTSGHPTKPWGPGKEEPKTFLETLEEMQSGESDKQQPEASSSAVDEPKPRTTPTHSLLTRIASLTQHYLTSPTPTLRKSLLDLVATVSPALASDEDTFLPLVNAIWPVIITRLRDPEPFVVGAACRALGALCTAAGDFLSTRFKTEWDDGLLKWFKQARYEVRRMPLKGATSGLVRDAGGIVIPGRTLVAKDGSVDAGLGRFSQPAQVWDAAVDLLAAMVGSVRVDDDMFEDVLSLLIDELPRRRDAARLLEVLEAVNADAVWLALYERGLVECPPLPVSVVVDGRQVDFVRMGKV